MDKRDEQVLRVAQQYVQKLHEAEQGEKAAEQRDDLWRAFWNHEGTVLAGKRKSK
jgi:hypothetical protein